MGSERGNYIGVYRDRGPRHAPSFVQLLPAGVGPEGLLAIPERGLFVVAAEADEDVRSNISSFKLQKGQSAYPTIVSDTTPPGPGGTPIGWGALSGLAGDREDPYTIYAVHDSFYDAARIYSIDLSEKPALIFDELFLKKDGATVNYDLEGIVREKTGASGWSRRAPDRSMTNRVPLPARTCSSRSRTRVRSCGRSSCRHRPGMTLDQRARNQFGFVVRGGSQDFAGGEGGIKWKHYRDDRRGRAAGHRQAAWVVSAPGPW